MSARKLIPYCLLISFIGLGDALMSYGAPIYLENRLGPLLMGLIISTSSAGAIIFDFIAGKQVGRWTSRRLLGLTIVIALFFPIIYLVLPPLWFFLVTGMVAWGIYYEFSANSNFRYISENLLVADYPKAWGIISSVKSIAYILGPILGGVLIERSLKLPFSASLGIFTVAAIGYLVIYQSTWKKTQETDFIVSQPSRERKSWRSEFVLLGKLFRQVWPLWFFVLTLFIIDATFWSVGTVLTEELRGISPFGGLLLALYMLPSLLVGVFTKRLAKPWGKKKIAFICGCLGGLFLWTAGWTTGTIILLLLVFLSSVCGAIAVPEIMATFEDYVARLKENGGEMVSIERLAENTAYVVGPILAGCLSVFVGSRLTLGFSGLLLMIISIVCILVVPRKIRISNPEVSPTWRR